MKRDRGIFIRLNSEEIELIKNKSENHGLTTSSFLRNLALNYPVHSITDERVAHNILKVNSELGKIGGLLKLLIKESKENRDIELMQKVGKVLDKLSKTQDTLRYQSLQIIKKSEK